MRNEEIQLKDKIKSIYDKNKLIILIVISILLTIGIDMQIDVAKNKIMFSGNKIIYLMLFGFSYCILKKSIEYKMKRLNIISMLLGGILAFFQVIGMMTKYNWISNEVILSKTVILYMLLIWSTYTILFSAAIKIIFNYLDKKNVTVLHSKISKPTIKGFFVIAIVFLLLWLPYFLNYYPGITSFDTNYQLLQGFHAVDYSNHHPILHTVIITFITKIGYSLTHSYNFGIALCSVIQMIACACTFSFVIYYMRKKCTNRKVVILTFIFFAFCPFVPQFSIAVWKDVPFTLCMTIFIIFLIEIIINDNKILKNIKYKVLLAIIITLLMFFRNNGIYIIMLTFPFVVIFKRKLWKQIIITFLIPMIFYSFITGPVFEKLNIEKSSSREMLSIPIQQMARIVKYKYNDIMDSEKDIINQYIPIEKAGELYDPTISDPIKNEFNDDNYNKDKMKLFKLYFKLALKYPEETIEAFICNTYGYYYPEVVTYAVATGTYKSPFEAEQFLDIYLDPIVKIPIIDKMINSIYEKKIPIVSLIANIGFWFWIFISMAMYCIYKRKYEMLLIYIPIGILYLTCLASPVSGELRYIYSMFTCMPLLIPYSIENKNEIN